MSTAELSRATRRLCALAPVIPVIVIEDEADAIPLAEALVKGGLPVLEVTLRTDAAIGAISQMCCVEGAHVGAGTVLTTGDLERALHAGATFGVSPGTTDPLRDAVIANELPFLFGASTVSEAMRLLDAGFDMLKFFPAEASGGAAALKSFAGPLPQVHFCPTGGVSLANAAQYLALETVPCVGGSWVVPKEVIARKDWGTITILAQEAAAL